MKSNLTSLKPIILLQTEMVVDDFIRQNIYNVVRQTLMLLDMGNTHTFIHFYLLLFMVRVAIDPEPVHWV